MWQSLVRVLNELNEQWGRFTLAKRAAIVVVGCVIIASLMLLGVWVGEKSYAPLYTELQPEQSINLVKILQEDNIPYLVSENGATISIPPEFIQQTLMKLAVKGMPAGNRPGLELFDKESFGTSSYVQRINYVRAIQGELVRTINTLRSVKKSNVHISMPPKSSFFEKTEDPKASVVIEQHMGKSLSESELKGIQNLVASSVEGLRPERVTVVDSSGAALSKDGSVEGVLSTTMMERQRSIERDFEAKIEDIVGRIVGRGKVVARVNAELDFDPLQEEETLFDPEQVAVRQSNKTEDNMEASRPQAGGVTGAQGALPGPASAAPEARQEVAKSRDNSTFEISTRIRRKEKALGAIRRLTVAVLVDKGEVRAPASEGADANAAPVKAGISEESLKTIENLVKDTIGYVGNRDSVTIESSAFATEDLQAADEVLVNQERRQLAFSVIRYGIVALFILLFFLIIVRPFIRWITGISVSKVETVLPRTVEELEEMHAGDTNALPGLAALPILEETVDIEKAEGELLRQKVISLVEMSPAKAAQVLAEWIAASEIGPDKKKKNARF
jgi:flagellar M-ring protein FliF